MDKIKIAFVKFGGLASGGTEKFLQQISANLPRDLFDVDYYYCDAAPYIGSDYKHATTDPIREEYMRSKGVNLIKFKVTYKDVTAPTHDWIGTDFWDKFDEAKYDIVQTGRSGHPEYPFYKMNNVAIVDSIHLSGMVDNQPNIAAVVHVSEWNKKQWVKAGGNASIAEVIYLPIEMPKELPTHNLRKELGLEGKFVYGMHQRADDGIYSPAVLEAYRQIETNDTAYILLGGSDKYREQAEQTGIRNFVRLPYSGDMTHVYSFLNTLDVYAHGRQDGEVNSQSLAEAMAFGKPIVSHFGSSANGHVETIGDAGIVHGHFDSYLFEWINLRENKGYREWRSENARRRFAEHYSFEKNIGKFVDLYCKVAGLARSGKYKMLTSNNEPDMKEWLDG